MAIDLVLIGVAMTLYPIALTVFILVLGSRRGVGKGAGFIVGWLGALAVVATVTILATGNTPPASGTAPAIGILVVKIVLGLVLLGVAERQRRRIGRPTPPKKEPAWQARLDEVSPVFAAGLGALVQPSVLVATAAATITGAKVSTVTDYLLLVVFGLVSASSFLTLEVYAALRPEQCDRLLTRLSGWIDRRMEVIIVIGAALVGLWLIGDSSYLLATSG